jgi:hypothetical protein
MEDADVVKNTVVKSCIIDIFAQCATKYPSSFKGSNTNYTDSYLVRHSFIKLPARLFKGRVLV